MNELNNFLNYLKINYNKETTINRYFFTIKKLYKFSKGNITQDSINAFYIRMNDTDKSQSTKNITRASIMAYQDFKKEKFDLPKNRRAESRGNTNNFITLKELNSITENFPLIFEKSHERKKLMLEFMFFTGLRASETINIYKHDIDFRKNRVNVTETKGKVDRFVPLFNKNLNKKLVHYMESIPDDKPIFKLDYGTLINNFSQIKNQLNLQYDFTPITMRHSFAMYCRRDLGLAIDIIQKLMGHKNISTTQIYCGVTEDMIDDAFKNIKIN